MSISELKSELVKLIQANQDPDLLEEIKKVLQEDSGSSSWNSLPKSQQKAILNASENAKKGIGLISHEEMVEKFGLTK